MMCGWLGWKQIRWIEANSDVLSCIISAWNYFQLPTPCLSIFKHQLPIHPWISIFHLTIIIKQPSSHSYWSTCPIQITLGPYLRIPQTLRWKTSPSPNVPSSCYSPFDHSGLLNVSSAPSWHFLLILSLLLWYPLWFTSQHQMISPLIPSFLPTHYFLHIYNPRDHLIWETSQQLGGEHTLSG